MSREAPIHQGRLADEQPISRVQWAERAIESLEACGPEVADALCLRWLEQSRTPGPQNDLFGTLYSDARFWAEVAPPHEVVAYTVAGLGQLPKRYVPQGTLKRVFVAIWELFDNAARSSFLRRVDPNGRSGGKGAV